MTVAASYKTRVSSLPQLVGALYLALAIGLIAGASGCAQPLETDEVPDEVLQKRVEAALLSASDVPGQDIAVHVSEGVVTLTGEISGVCERCGGVSTPAGLGTVLQSVGAIVRAVPGVKDVRFSIDTGAGPAPVS